MVLEVLWEFEKAENRPKSECDTLYTRPKKTKNPTTLTRPKEVREEGVVEKMINKRSQLAKSFKHSNFKRSNHQ